MELPSPTRRSENGDSSSARLTPTANDAGHPRPDDRWHLDEVFTRINGRTHYLWRAVDQEGDVLDILVQRRRDNNSAKVTYALVVASDCRDAAQAQGATWL